MDIHAESEPLEEREWKIGRLELSWKIGIELAGASRRSLPIKRLKKKSSDHSSHSSFMIVAFETECGYLATCNGRRNITTTLLQERRRKSILDHLRDKIGWEYPTISLFFFFFLTFFHPKEKPIFWYHKAFLWVTSLAMKVLKLLLTY